MAEASEANILNELSLKMNDLKFTTSILDLPNEVLVKIFVLLCQEEILKNVARVCKKFLEITRSSYVLPIIRIISQHVDGIYAKKIQNCHGIYPASKIEMDVYSAEYSDMENLQHVSNFIKNMFIGFGKENTNIDSFPIFENLEYLHLRHIAIPLGPNTIPHLNEVPKFWSNFPKLTYLHFDGLDVMFRTVIFTNIVGLNTLTQSWIKNYIYLFNVSDND